MINRILRHAVLLGVVFACIAARPSALSAQLRHGDVSGEGTVSALDAQAILSSVVGLTLPGTFVPANGVADCSAGRTLPTALDAQIVLMYVIGLNVSSYCVGQTFGPGATAIALTPLDSSVLLGRTRVFKAILHQANGQLVTRPITWSSSAPSVAAIDSVKNDSLAYVRGTAQGSSTITAFADGTALSTPLQVVNSYAGVVITPQRGDTLNQIGGQATFNAYDRDSVGTLVTIRPSFWTAADTNIIAVRTPAPTTAQYNAGVEAKASGTTWLYATSQLNPAYKDSVPVTVLLPSVNSCIAGTGTLHSNVTYATPQTWTAATNPHFVTGSVHFNAGANLTIDPGVLVCMTSGASMNVHNGAHVTALGTVANPITVTSDVPSGMWYWIQLGDAGSFNQPTTDTSVFRHTLFENSTYGVFAYHRHVLTLDGVHVRQFGYTAVQFYTSGSTLVNSVIDSTRVGYNGTAVSLNRGSVMNSVVRTGPGGVGISVGDSAVVSSDSIIGGNVGVQSICCSVFGVTFNDLAVRNTSGIGLDLPYEFARPSSANVTVANAGSYAFRGLVRNIAVLFPDSLRQETLKGHGRDTIVVTGGSWSNTSITTRADLPWLVTAEAQADTGARLIAHPGTQFNFTTGGFRFTNGARLDARGSNLARVTFRAMPGNTFSGLYFQNAPAPGGQFPPPAPVDTSYLINVSVDSANYYCGALQCSSVASDNRHVVIIDSSRVRFSQSYGAVTLAAPGSRISRSVIDTTGTPTSYAPALTLGAGTLAESTTVRRSGGVGVEVAGTITSVTDTIRLRDLHILGSLDAALHAEGGRIVGDSASVIATGNAYPYRGFVDNFAAVALDSLSQLRLLGNSQNVAVIVGRSDRVFAGRPGRLDTLKVIPQLPWQLVNDVHVDTLARLMPSPGARIGFWSGTLYFQRGGRFLSRGTQAAPVLLEKYSASSGNFNGLQFANAGGTATDTSYLTNTVIHTVQSCQGGTFGCAAVNTSNRHVLIVDSSTVRGSTYTAIALSAPGSRISRTMIDSSGTASYPSLQLGAITAADSTTIQHGGGIGVEVLGSITVPTDTIRLRALTIIGNADVALHAEGGRIVGDSASVTASGNAYPYRGFIDNYAVLARDSLSQLKLVGNSQDLAVIIGRSDRVFAGRPGRLDTLKVIPQMPWQVVNDGHVDTLARLMPSPGSRIGFWGGSLMFQRGGRLLSIGAPGVPVIFEKYSPAAGSFNGLQFANAGGTASDTSFLTNTIIHTVQSCQGGTFGCAAVNTNNRHVLIVDSSTVRGSTYTAIALSAAGSRISRSIIDSAGTASYPSLQLGAVTAADSTAVQNGGGIGVEVLGSITVPTDTIRLNGLTIFRNADVGLHAEGGRILADPGAITAVQNAYPYRGFVDNFAMFARDSISQSQLVGNTTDVARIVGRSDRPLVGDPLVNVEVPLTLEATRELNLEFVGTMYVDTLARFAPRPGSRITFSSSGGLQFEFGGTMYANGTATDTITFGPVTGGGSSSFYGLMFNNPRGPIDPFLNTPTASSYLSYVKIDSANGASGGAGTPFTCCAAVISADRHLVSISNARFHRNFNGAIYLGTRHSSLSTVRVDTTGFTTTPYAAVALNDSVDVTDLVVNRSGGPGVVVDGNAINFVNVRVANAQGAGITVQGNTTAANGGSQGLVLSGFTVDSAQGVGVSINSSLVTLQSCDVLRGATHGFALGSSYSGVQIHNCNIGGDFNLNEQNLGQGVFNPAGNTNAVDATNNWWGVDPTGAPYTPTNGGVNGYSGLVNFTPILNGKRVP